MDGFWHGLGWIVWARVDADRVGFGDDWRTAYFGGTEVQLVGDGQEKTGKTGKTKQKIPSPPTTR